MGFLLWPFKALLHILEPVALWLGLLGLLVYGALYLVRRFNKTLYAMIPMVSLVEMIAGTVAAVGLGIKVLLIVLSILGAQAKIAKLEKDNADKAARITELNQTNARKDDQKTSTNASDTKADIIYRDRYRVIEKLRVETDLSLANKLALDLSTNFYEPEKSDAKVPVN